MKDGIIKVILKYLLLYLLILIILVGTIAIVITLSGVYLEIINYNLDLVGIINVSLITILVLITGAYGYFTWQIVDDQRKSRQIAFIERRLEKLYLPLKDVLENPHTPYGKSERQIGWQKTEKIIPFQYLAYDDSEKKIMDFIKHVLELKEKDDLSFKNIRDDKIIDDIKKDIDRCEKELNKLTKK